jgi:hypothetical protein
MIAIHTKYLSPTNTRGARIKAYTSGYGDIKGFTATIGYPHELSGVDCHFKAVKAMIEANNLDWNTDGMRYGDSADGRGFSFCFDHSKVTA